MDIHEFPRFDPQNKEKTRLLLVFIFEIRVEIHTVQGCYHESKHFSFFMRKKMDIHKISRFDPQKQRRAFSKVATMKSKHFWFFERKKMDIHKTLR